MRCQGEERIRPMGSFFQSRIGLTFSGLYSLVLLGVMALVIAVTTWFIRDFGQFAVRQNQESLRRTSYRLLFQYTRSQAEYYDNYFHQWENCVKILARQAEEILSNPDVYGKSPASGEETLRQVQPQIFSNGPNARSASLVWGRDNLTSDLQTRLTALSHLDPLMEQIYQEFDPLIAAYLILNEGICRYHPNTDLTPALANPEKALAKMAPRMARVKPENNPQRKPIWNSPYIDQAGKGMLLTVRAPLYAKEGAYLGHVGLDLEMERLLAFLSRTGPQESAFHMADDPRKPFKGEQRFLVDQAGRLLTYSSSLMELLALGEMRFDNVPEGMSLHLNLEDSENVQVQRLVKAMQNGSSGVVTMPMQGESHLVAFFPMQSTQWSLAVVLPEKEALASVANTRRAMNATVRNVSLTLVSVMLALLVLLFFITLHFFIRNVAKPLSRLAKGVDQFRKGHYNVQVDLKRQDEIGKLANAFNAMSADLTQNLETLKVSEERYRRITENVPDLIYRYRFLPEPHFEFVNSAAEAFTGYSSEELMENPDIMERLIFPEDHKKWLKFLEEGKFEEVLQIRWQRKDGSTVWTEQRGSMVRDERDWPVIVEAVARDVTESRKAEEERIRLVAAIEQAAEIILMTDATGFIQFANPAFETITGFPRSAILEQNVLQLQANPDLQLLFKEMRTSIQEGKLWTGQIESRRQDGSLVYLDATTSPVRNSSQSIVNFVTVMRDASHEMELERQLRHSQKMEALGTLAGGVAHDFNNILSAILGHNDLALRALSPDDDTHRYLEEIEKAGERAADLVRQILAFSRQTEQKRRPIRVQTIMKETIKLLRGSLPSNIDIAQEIDDECGHIDADPTQVHQVVMNLCTNAYHAMRKSGGILELKLDEISIQHEKAIQHLDLKAGDYVRISIRDTGCGMKKDAIDRIFEPYYTTKAPGEGTGLGLATVHGIVTSHGGAIHVYSEEGKGSLFHIYFPRGLMVESSQSKEPLRDYSGNERVLLVDDEVAITNFAEISLTDMGYQVTCCNSSHHALDLFQEDPNQFDIVITDQMMPGLTGEDLARAIQKIRPAIPIILCSGFNESIKKVETEDLFKTSLLKPVIALDLARAIRSVFDGN